MRFHIGLALFYLLAAPLAGGEEPAGLLLTGSLEVDLDPAALSFLLVNPKDDLCSGEPLSPQGECDLSVRPLPLQGEYAPSVSPPRLGLFLSDVWSLDGALRAAVQLRESTPWLGSAPIATECGLWEVSMGLDPDAAQPLSELALEPSVEDPAQGVFAGVVKIAVVYRFANQETGTSLELPASHSLELSGHWAAVPGGAPGLADGASNLVLFGGFFDGQWLDVPACGAWGGFRCPVCFKPPPEALKRLERLNAGLER